MLLKALSAGSALTVVDVTSTESRELSGPVIAPAAGAGAAGARERLGRIDALRGWACFGIVLFHTCGDHWCAKVGLAGLMVFLLLVPALGWSGAQSRGWGEQVRRRAGRLLMPWLFWSAVYLLNYLLPRLHAGAGVTPHDLGLSASSLLVGGTIHLWFLPFAFLGGVALLPLGGPVWRLRPAVAIGGLLAAAGALLAGACVVRSMPGFGGLVAPWPQWIDALPSLPLGIALAVAAGRGRFLAMVCAGALAGCALAAVIDPRGPALEYALAVPLVAWAMLRPVAAGPIARVLAPLSLGVYLVHPLVLMVLNRVLAGPAWVRAVVVFAVACGVVAVLRKTPIRRFV